jgi:hypothetical protein
MSTVTRNIGTHKNRTSTNDIQNVSFLILKRTGLEEKTFKSTTTRDIFLPKYYFSTKKKVYIL